MTVEEREAFLAGLHVAILAIDEPGRGPLALPIWYEWVDGEVRLSMNGDSLKARLLRAAGRATVTVQREKPPYAYVSVEGPVTVTFEHGDTEALATRYLGPELGTRYAEQNPPDDASAIVRLRPEHWRTYDYRKVLA